MEHIASRFNFIVNIFFQLVVPPPPQGTSDFFEFIVKNKIGLFPCLEHRM